MVVVVVTVILATPNKTPTLTPVATANPIAITPTAVLSFIATH